MDTRSFDELARRISIPRTRRALALHAVAGMIAMAAGARVSLHGGPNGMVLPVEAKRRKGRTIRGDDRESDRGPSPQGPCKPFDGPTIAADGTPIAAPTAAFSR